MMSETSDDQFSMQCSYQAEGENGKSSKNNTLQEKMELAPRGTKGAFFSK
jgi:hypothetical protein